jgi:hypothetical protein
MPLHLDTVKGPELSTRLNELHGSGVNAALLQ